MSRRLVAGLLAFGLVAVLVIGAALVDTPYVTFKPGPTINVLGTCRQFSSSVCTSSADDPVVQVTGRKTYQDTGDLRMVTVVPSGPDVHLSIFGAMLAWVERDVAVLPRDAVYKPQQTSKQVRQESAAQMSSSQDAATAAALTALKIPFETEVSIAIAAVDDGGASAGKLKSGDLVVAVDGRAAESADDFVAQIKGTKPGTKLVLTVLRDGDRRKVEVTTRANPENKTESKINVGIGATQLSLKLPFKVKFRLSENIGGPSAGMMFALSLYDLLTPGSLTGGKSIAGSGEISPTGVVGPIGGIGQKLVGAQRDGAHLFLVAQENCAEAVRSHYDPSKLRLVKVHTLTDAIDALETWRKDPNAALPRCTK